MKQRRRNPRQALIRQGSFLKLEQKLLMDESTAGTIVPPRLMEIEQAVQVAAQRNPDDALAELLLSMVVSSVKHVVMARGYVNKLFVQDAPCREYQFNPDFVAQSQFLKLFRAEEHTLKLVDAYVKTRAALAKISRPQRKGEPLTTLRVVPAADQPNDEKRTAAL